MDHVERELFKATLMDDCEFHPERLGPKKTIYSVEGNRPLVSLFWEGPRKEPAWKRLGNWSYSHSLFTHLWEVVADHAASWVYITYPDDADISFEWAYAVDKLSWGVRYLSVFETEPAEQGGTQILCLYFHDRRGIIVFVRGMIVFGKTSGFEIAYYGDRGRWEELNIHLALDDSAV